MVWSALTRTPVKTVELSVFAVYIADFIVLLDYWQCVNWEVLLFSFCQWMLCILFCGAFSFYYSFTWNMKLLQIFTLTVGILFCIETVKLTFSQSCGKGKSGDIWVMCEVSASHIHFFRYVLIWSLLSICVKLWTAS